jgi:L-ascorbate metabolism protein UlaG (beta-lactamase superfamily)
MDRVDAAEAARLIGAKQVIPCHYDTFPPIQADAQAFKADVEAASAAKVVALAPGESHTL